MDVPVGELLRPASVEEALALLAVRPGVRPLAGGTDLVVQLRDGRRRDEALLDLGALGMRGIAEADGCLEIGAGATMEAIAADPRVAAAFPALAAAAGQVGAWPIQCRATLGGNLANASPAADTAPALLVADADLLLASAAGRRRVAIDRFFTGPGRTVLAPDELILAIRLPLARDGGTGRRVERFAKVGPRREQVIAVVSLAGRAVLDDGGAIAELRLALGSVAPTPVRARHAEAALAGRRPDAAARRAAAEALQLDIAPIDDVRAPARYRRIAAVVLLDRFLCEAAGG